MIKSFKAFNESVTEFKDINGKIPRVDDIIVHENEVGKVTLFRNGRMMVDFRGHFLELNPNSSFEIINPDEKVKKAFNIKSDNKSDILTLLKALKRYDIDTVDNGEFIEQIEREEEDGKYVKADDIENLIIQLAKIV